MIRSLESAIVRIRMADGRVVGAGFLVAEKQVLTCAHVVVQALGLTGDIPAAPQAEVHLDFPLVAPGCILTARVIHWQLESDVAGLELDGEPPAVVRPVRLVTADDLWNHAFRAFGFPAGYDNGVWTSGRMLGREATGWVQIEDVKEPGYWVQPGFSGTPVWDEQLNGVAGMAVAAEGRPEIKAAFMLPAGLLIETWPVLGMWAIPPCPYRGLLAFNEQDAPLFFGREVFTERLIEAVKHQSLVAVIGPSGSGKSSVVFAGLLPCLRHQGRWIIAHFRPGSRPFHALAATLLPLLEPQTSEVDRLVETRKLAKVLGHADISIYEVIERILQKSPDNSRFLLVADQFEELYTLCSSLQVRHRFLDGLLEAVRAWYDKRELSFTPVLTLRTDFLGQALTYRPFADAFQDHNLVLGPMTRPELRRAIENPAGKLGIAFEAGLVERILDDVGGEPGNLPLLEFALTMLWERQASGQLPHAGYEVIGRVEGALACYAEEVYAGLSQADQESARRIFVQLVQPGEGTEASRRRATQMELGSTAWPLVQRLADARLVTTGRDQASGLAIVEVAHETLIRGWNRLREWMQSDRAFRTWQERLRVMLRQWKAAGRDESALLHGVLLAEGESWLTQRGPDLSDEERVFIQTSLVEDERRRQRELEQEREFRQMILDRDAETRRKVARDLHDGPTQSIATIAMRLNFIRSLLDKEPVSAKEELQELEALARRTVKEIRTMLFTLRPVVLETHGLKVAVEQLVQKLQETEDLPVQLEVEDPGDRLDVNGQAMAFFITEEAINNAKNHANNIWVRMYIQDDCFVTEIEHDGSEAVAQGDSPGLIGLQERAELVEGQLAIESQPGRGTKVRLVVPLKGARSNWG